MNKFYAVATVFMLCLGCQAYADEAAPQTETEASVDGTSNENLALQSFTKGDQTDVFAVPLDEDELEQDEELNELETRQAQKNASPSSKRMKKRLKGL